MPETEETPNRFAVEQQHHFLVADTDNLIVGLTPGHVYVMTGSQDRGIFIDKLSEGFPMPPKLYGLEEDFINRIEKTWHNTDSNMGVMANGIQGAGKTVTMKKLAMRMNMPILLITQNMGQAMVDYISVLRQNIIVFIDEYEKIFASAASRMLGDTSGEKQDSTLLTLMDGVMKTKARRLFLLTTNQEYININMQQRPGRIRYKKQFGNLERKVIEEIVDDKLIHKELRQVTIDFIAKLQMISIDIVTSVVTEVNIHQEDPEVFADVFNVKKTEDAYDLQLIQGDGTPITLESAIKPKNGADMDVDENVYGLQTYYGTVDSVNEDGTFQVNIPIQRFLKHRFLAGLESATMSFKRVVGYHESYRGHYVD